MKVACTHFSFSYSLIVTVDNVDLNHRHLYWKPRGANQITILFGKITTSVYE